MTGYLRKTKEVAKLRGEVQLATLSLYLGVPLGRAEISQGLGWEKGLGAAPGFLLCSWHLEGKQAAVAVGRICYYCGILFSAAFSYHEWSSACRSGRCTGTPLTPDKKRILHHLPGCLRGNPGISEPLLPPRKPLPALFGSRAATGQPQPFFCHCFGVFAAVPHSPCLLGHPSAVPATAIEFIVVCLPRYPYTY